MKNYIYQPNKGFFVISLNISETKGSIKKPVNEVTLDNQGIINDAHSGKWHRQISLLNVESIKAFENQVGKKIMPGEFAENITTEGFELSEANIFDRFVSNKNVILEVTQIGKKCHGAKCTIYEQTGDCIMPRKGIFCKVINEGNISVNDYFSFYKKNFIIKIITLSDRASSGEYEDISGKIIEDEITNFFSSKKWLYDIQRIILPDEKSILTEHFSKFLTENPDIIITTGGTGIGPRDITPETLKPFFDKEIPGIMEYIRIKYGQIKPSALISRSIAGIKGNTFIYALPGSTKATKEYMTEILSIQEHLFYMLNGIDNH